ncbi:MAG TPA: hypothetical protein VJP86_13090 [Vicinamibacterales bacterium]|jgi:hypothetical protein|nr:hypothetical protein [Vicinamibacterales bacterium]
MTRLTLVAAAVLLMMMTTAARAAELIDRVLAVAAGTLITLSDVNTARELHLIAAPTEGDPVQVILPRLIDRALMLAEVERYAPPEPTDADVNERLEGIQKTFPSPEAFRQAMTRVGTDAAHLRETLRQDLRLLMYLDQRFIVQQPDESEVSRYFEDHAARFAVNGRTPPLDEVRSRVLEAIIAERRQRLVDDWIAGLRRRSEILDLTASVP